LSHYDSKRESLIDVPARTSKKATIIDEALNAVKEDKEEEEEERGASLYNTKSRGKSLNCLQRT
jgi:hypothetical protein